MYKTASTVGLRSPLTGTDIITSTAGDVTQVHGHVVGGLDAGGQSNVTPQSSFTADRFTGLTARQWHVDAADGQTFNANVCTRGTVTTITNPYIGTNAMTTGWTTQVDGIWEIQLNASCENPSGYVRLRLCILISYNGNSTADQNTYAQDLGIVSNYYCTSSTSWTGFIPAGGTIQLGVSEWVGAGSSVVLSRGCSIVLLREVDSGFSTGTYTLST